MRPIQKRIEALEARRPSNRDDVTWNLRLLSLSELRTLQGLVLKAGAEGQWGDLSRLTPLEIETVKGLALKAGVIQNHLSH